MRSQKGWFKNKRINILSLVLPLITVSSIYFISAPDFPASITRIDPEFVCLLNGLNVSLLKIHNIGFTDSPGTPFLVLSGILLRIVHFLFGSDSIIDDVLSRPDYYIESASYVLLVITLILMVWGGNKVHRSTQSTAAMLLIQSTIIISPICFYLQVRFNMDRISPLLVFVFAVYTISYLYNSISSNRFAILSGIILGIGFITKFNFVVLTIIPVLMLPPFKYWLKYAAAFIVSAFISFLPIIDKFQDVKRFLSSLFFNKGSYGTGEEGIASFDLIIKSFKNASQLNLSFVLISCLAFVVLVIYLIKKKKDNKKRIGFLMGYFIAIALIIVLASKNYKNYYLAPVLGLSGTSLFLVWEYFKRFIEQKKCLKMVILFVLISVLSLPTLFKMNQQIALKKKNNAYRNETVNYIKNHIDATDYLFLEPTWKTGAMVEDALLYGVSYVAGRNDFTPYYLKHYPRVLSFEGTDRPIKHFRTKDAKIYEILNESNTMYLFSGSGRNTKKLMQELEKNAKLVGMSTDFDTTFVNTNNDERLIKATFNPALDQNKQIIQKTYFNNMEASPEAWKQQGLSSEKSFSGTMSDVIKKGDKYGSTFHLKADTVMENPITALEFSCKYLQESEQNGARLIIEITNKDGNVLRQAVFCSDYSLKSNTWNDFQYKLYLTPKFQQVNELKVYFYNSKKVAVYIDDITVSLSIQLPNSSI
ncbi:hypothetical protein [Maribellus sediminis]|uniref:hypothetical protein n=1 Tax=Maribellus sediminis TaxID=2696285 RepID=UPI001430E84C|nr:hypothetical protein [Maribellus sediminis]